MSRAEARNLQRIYQRKGWHTHTSTVIYSGREAEGFHYIVWVIDDRGTEHVLYERTERIGQTRCTTV